jgi:hypothetical protein
LGKEKQTIVNTYLAISDQHRRDDVVWVSNAAQGRDISVVCSKPLERVSGGCIGVPLRTMNVHPPLVQLDRGVGLDVIYAFTETSRHHPMQKLSKLCYMTIHRKTLIRGQMATHDSL